MSPARSEPDRQAALPDKVVLGLVLAEVVELVDQVTAFCPEPEPAEIIISAQPDIAAKLRKRLGQGLVERRRGGSRAGRGEVVLRIVRIGAHGKFRLDAIRDVCAGRKAGLPISGRLEIRVR